MIIDRRRLLLGSLTGAAAIATPALAAPLSRYGLDAAQFGVHATTRPPSCSAPSTRPRRRACR